MDHIIKSDTSKITDKYTLCNKFIKSFQACKWWVEHEVLCQDCYNVYLLVEKGLVKDYDTSKVWINPAYYIIEE